MQRIWTIAARALIAVAASGGPALAMDQPADATWHWTQTGGNFDVVWHGPEQRAPHGGGGARLVGGGENAAVVYADTPARQSPADASLSGGGENAMVTRSAPAAPGRTAAGFGPAAPGRRG